ncbi:MAG: type II secretion system protein GspG [Candidatus Sumerlaeota bacterium]|nr:type II secretion system protein GspG [Candidatus Sumerlaeota bacterium]
MEAQTRSKVSRAKADMRSLTTALESYMVDQNQYPYKALNYPIRNINTDAPWNIRLIPITTPVSYMSSLPRDPFRHQVAGTSAPGYSDNPIYTTFIYQRSDLRVSGAIVLPEGRSAYLINSAGPDNNVASDSYWSISELEAFERMNIRTSPQRYDPTNGTLSPGDIYRYGPGGEVR